MSPKKTTVSTNRAVVTRPMYAVCRLVRITWLAGFDASKNRPLHPPHRGMPAPTNRQTANRTTPYSLGSSRGAGPDIGGRAPSVYALADFIARSRRRRRTRRWRWGSARQDSKFLHHLEDIGRNLAWGGRWRAGRGGRASRRGSRSVRKEVPRHNCNLTVQNYGRGATHKHIVSPKVCHVITY